MATPRGRGMPSIRRTSGLSTSAMTPATANISSTGPAARAIAHTATRSSGRVTSWIQRGTTTLGRASSSSVRSVRGSSSGMGLYPTTKLLRGRAPPCVPPSGRPSGAALALGDLRRLVLDVLLGASELVLGLALALLLTTLALEAGVTGKVPGGLLGATRDLVEDAHLWVSFVGFPPALPTVRDQETPAHGATVRQWRTRRRTGSLARRGLPAALALVRGVLTPFFRLYFLGGDLALGVAEQPGAAPAPA